jgi:hypothetical protein
VVRARLEHHGLAATVAWARLGTEAHILQRVALPLKRILGADRPVADPVAAGGPAHEHRAALPRRTGPVAWVWTVFVAGVSARSYRRAARPIRGGVSVVCDRWVDDSLIDLEVRYGRHPAAAWVLRRSVKQPDIAILLAIDARTSAERKPGDQAEHVLARMEQLYDDAVARGRLQRIDALQPHEKVSAELERLIDALMIDPQPSSRGQTPT